MTEEANVDSLEKQLNTLLEENQGHNEKVQSLLRNFGSLIHSYNLLRSNYEEAIEARERYKKLAKGQVSG